MKRIFIPIFCLFFSFTAFSQTGFIVNEVSQGSSGTEEYVELIVVAPVGTCTVDIHNWIIDDNNGDFSGGPAMGAGIASGHVRFTADPQWQNVPTGSLILIYNNMEKNPSITLPDDPSDSNNDKVYILPANSTLLERCTTIPAVGNAAYSPCTYGTASWSPLGMSNDGDVMQVRTPTGAFFHGLSFGDGGCNCIGAGPGVRVDNCTGGGCVATKVYSFTHNINNDYTSAANYTTGTAPSGETPGTTNNAANATWRNSLICPLPLPELTLQSATLENQVQLQYQKSNDEYVKNIVLQHSTITTPWETLADMNYSNTYTHTLYDNETHFYRLLFEDKDGNVKISNVVNATITVTLPQAMQIYPNPASDKMNIGFTHAENGILQVFNLAGQSVYQTNVQSSSLNFDISQWENGMYIIRFISQQGTPITQKFMKTSY